MASDAEGLGLQQKQHDQTAHAAFIAFLLDPVEYKCADPSMELSM